jgi:hypothetical protein
MVRSPSAHSECGVKPVSPDEALSHPGLPVLYAPHGRSSLSDRRKDLKENYGEDGTSRHAVRAVNIWGPALVAAVLGAIPGTIALLRTTVETKVALIQPWVVQTKNHARISIRVVNQSTHAIVVEWGQCGLAAGPGSSMQVPRSGLSLPPDEGKTMFCEFDAPASRVLNRISFAGGGGSFGGSFGSSGSATKPDLVQFRFLVGTSDGRTWAWSGECEGCGGFDF